MYSLSWIIDNLQEGQVAKALFAHDQVWFITNDAGTFRYCNEDGSEIYQLVGLTFSNLRAFYEIM